MRRREFISKGAAAGGAAAFAAPYLLLSRKSCAAEPGPGYPDIVAVRDGEPEAMFDRALEALGGMGRFVAKGQTVVVKPNIGWPREPETGANTNPALVKRIVEACVGAGAAKVYVFDHSVGRQNALCYEKSGIEAAAKSAGGVMAPAGEQRHFQTVEIPNATRLKSTEVHELVLEHDILINVPVLKHHKGTKATIAMKNLMGVVWDRPAYHKQGLQECIADFCLFRKPTLNIVDAYRVTMDNGPQRARPEDIALKKMLLVSTDIVAVDSAAVRILGNTPDNAEHIALGARKGIGNMNLDELNIQRVAL